jgi:hypothetical protein
MIMKEDKYEYKAQRKSLTSPDDTAHIFLADLCRGIQDALYANEKNLQWAQEAHHSRYHF